MTTSKPTDIREFWIEWLEFNNGEIEIYKCSTTKFKVIPPSNINRFILYADYEQLKAENEYKKEYLISGYETMLNELNTANEKLKQQVKDYQQALEFYGAGRVDHEADRSLILGLGRESEYRISKYYGDIAREVLKKWGNV